MSFRVYFFKKSQSILEYAVIIACIAAALVSMQIYIKRGIQGRLRQAADDIGEQYAPVNVDSNITITLDSTSTINSELVLLEGLDDDGRPRYGIETTVDLDETTTKTGKEELGQFEGSLF